MYGAEVGIFMRPTIYASAASCRHIMVLPWKCKSYLPTLGPSHGLTWEEEFPDEELSDLLEPPDLSKSNCARSVLPGLLYFPSLEEFLLGGFASHSGLELPPDWLLLSWSRWPGLHSHLGQLSGWQWWWRPSHILQPSCFLHPSLYFLHQLLLLLCCRWGLTGWGWVMYWEGPLSFLCQSSPHLSGSEQTTLPPLSSFLGVTFVLAIL